MKRVTSCLPLFYPQSVHWWAGRKQLRTPREAFASHWCDSQLCSWPSSQLNEWQTFIIITRNYFILIPYSSMEHRLYYTMLHQRVKEHRLTVQVVVFLTLRVREGVQLLQQQGVLQDPLDGFDQVRLQRGWMLLSGVSLSQESLEIWVGLCWRSRNVSIHSFSHRGQGDTLL